MTRRDRHRRVPAAHRIRRRRAHFRQQPQVRPSSPAGAAPPPAAFPFPCSGCAGRGGSFHRADHRCIHPRAAHRACHHGRRAGNTNGARGAAGIWAMRTAAACSCCSCVLEPCLLLQLPQGSRMRPVLHSPGACSTALFCTHTKLHFMMPPQWQYFATALPVMRTLCRRRCWCSRRVRWARRAAWWARWQVPPCCR